MSSDIDTIKSDIDNLNAKFDLLLKHLNLVVEHDYTLLEWLDKWIVDYKASKYIVDGIETSGLRNIRNVIKNHIEPNIQNVRLSELTTSMVDSAIQRVNSSRMRDYTYDVYNESLNKAYDLGLMPKNIMRLVERPIHIRKKGLALTIEQQREFLRIVYKHPKRYLFVFYLITGVRLSEALSVEVSDIDYGAGVIHIRGTKTISSDRRIPITSDVAKLLKKINKKSGRLFPYSVNAVKCAFKRLKNQYNLPYTIHSLRHTYATRLIEGGASMKYVQIVLGHSSYEVTANIYVDVLDNFYKAETAKIQGIFNI